MSRTRRVPPTVVLAVGIAVIAVLAAVTTALRMPQIVSFDESVYKLSASQYATGGLSSLVHDQVARGLARLYPLLLAPVFWLFDGDVAVRAARALGCLAFALTAVPVYLLTRPVTRSAWAPVAAGLLAITVPWLTISTVLFSESVGYPLLAATVAVMLWALRAPSPLRDLAVLVLCAALVGVRVQFIAVPVAWLVIVALLELRPARTRTGSWRTALQATWRRFPVLLTGVGVAVLIALVAVVAGQGGSLAHRAFGPYLSGHDALPTDVGLAALFEVAMLALGTGLVPLVLALAFWGAALRGERGDEARRLTVVTIVLVTAVFAVALAGQSGWLGPDVTEERYFIYAAPLILVAALAALDLPVLRRGTLLAGSAFVLVLLALAPTTAGLSAERSFLVPVAASSANLAGRINPSLAKLFGVANGTGERDLFVVLALVVLGVALLVVRRARWAMLVPAVLVQLFFCGYAFATLHNRVPGVPGVTSSRGTAKLGWVDRATSGSPDVSLLVDAGPSALGGDVELAFFNDETNRTSRFPLIVPGGPPYPVSALPSEQLLVGPDLALTSAPPTTRVVLATADSPYVQLAGRRLAVAPDGGRRVLERLAMPARAVWTAVGLGPEGVVPGPVRLTAQPARVTLVLAVQPGTPGGTVRVRLAGHTRRVAVDAGAPREVRIDACGGAGGAGGPVTGSITPVAPPAGGTTALTAVRLASC